MRVRLTDGRPKVPNKHIFLEISLVTVKVSQSSGSETFSSCNDYLAMPKTWREDKPIGKSPGSKYITHWAKGTRRIIHGNYNCDPIFGRSTLCIQDCDKIAILVCEEKDLWHKCRMIGFVRSGHKLWFSGKSVHKIANFHYELSERIEGGASSILGFGVPLYQFLWNLAGLFVGIKWRLSEIFKIFESSQWKLERKKRFRNEALWVRIPHPVCLTFHF